MLIRATRVKAYCPNIYCAVVGVTNAHPSQEIEGLYTIVVRF